jgi:hypothetical protein
MLPNIFSQLFRWFGQNQYARAGRKGARKYSTFKPALEELEARLSPALANLIDAADPSIGDTGSAEIRLLGSPPAPNATLSFHRHQDSDTLVNSVGTVDRLLVTVDTFTGSHLDPLIGPFEGVPAASFGFSGDLSGTGTPIGTAAFGTASDTPGAVIGTPIDFPVSVLVPSTLCFSAIASNNFSGPFPGRVSASVTINGISSEIRIASSSGFDGTFTPFHINPGDEVKLTVSGSVALPGSYMFEIAYLVVLPKGDVTGAFGTIPDHATASKTVDVPTTVTNEGSGKVEGTLSIAYYISTDTSLDGADVQVGTISGQSITLESGQSANFTATLNIPAATEAGLYHLIAKIDSANAIDESNEDNNLVVQDLKVLRLEHFTFACSG